jgi:hypothetical protein
LAKNKKSYNDSNTPSLKVIDEVEEEAVGAVHGLKSGNKQQSNQKQHESGNQKKKKTHVPFAPVNFIMPTLVPSSMQRQNHVQRTIL